MLLVSRRSFMLSSCYAATGLISSGASARSAAPRFETPGGFVAGEWQDRVAVFRGIPYTGLPSRWRRCEPVKPWSGTRVTVEPAPAAPQVDFTGAMDEQCQTLNIWTPAIDGRRRPVMFWCHGGGFESGSGNPPLFDGAMLARQHDVVVVSVNHRLGALGALPLESILPDLPDAGRVGMLDILDALRWVKTAIGACGGDPDCVTIFGQSGGGGKVIALLGMATAAGLFHRAIVQSGSMRQTLADPEDGQKTLREFLTATGLTEREAGRLETTPLAQLLAAQKRVIARRTPGLRSFAPVIDGTVFPEQPFVVRAPAVSRTVPLMIGTTSEELRPLKIAEPALFALDETGLTAALQPLLGERTTGAIELYRRTSAPEATPSDLYFEITADEMYGSHANTVADLKHAQRGAAVFRYLYTYAPDRATRGSAPARGAGHGTEMAFVLGLVGRPGQPPATPDANRLSQDVSSAWAAFARYGNPTSAALDWPVYAPSSRATMILDAPTRPVLDPQAERRLWWERRWGARQN